MKIFKVVGVILLVCAIVTALGVIGCVDMEDQQFIAGEIEASEFTPDSVIYKWIGISVAMGVIGGLFIGVQFLIDTSHLSTFGKAEKRFIPKSEKLTTAKLGWAPYEIPMVPLTADDQLGTFTFRETEYALYRTEYDLYVITAVNDPDIQYWFGSYEALKKMEADFDNEE